MVFAGSLVGWREGTGLLLSAVIVEFYLSLAGVVSDATRFWYGVRLGEPGRARGWSLLGFLGDVELSAVSISDLRRWRAALAGRSERWDDHPGRPTASGGLSVWTLHGYLRACRRFFRWCVEEEMLDVSPAARLKLPSLPDEPPKAIRVGDFERILEAARSSARDYALVRFLAVTGSRVGGVSGLQVDDVELNHP